MPKLLSKEVYKILKLNWIFAVILIIAFLVFGYICIFQIPFALFKHQINQTSSPKSVRGLVLVILICTNLPASDSGPLKTTI